MAVEQPDDHGEAEPLLGPSRQTQPSHYRVLVEDADQQPAASQAGATVAQAVFNLVNIYVGVGLLAMPFAFALSGWSGLLALFAMTLLFCLSGKLIVKGLNTLDRNTPQTYPALGIAALGHKGQYVVAGFAIAEFFGGSCIMIMVIWKQLVQCLPQGGMLGFEAFHVAVVVGSLAIVPLLLIPSFRGLSWLSLLGCCSSAIVVVTMAAVVALDPHRLHMPHQPPEPHDIVRLGIVQAAGIFAISVSGHSSLPALRNSMQRKQDFHLVLNIGFLCMAIIYGIVGSAGYYYFGRSAAPLVTSDLAMNAPFSGKSVLVPGLTLDRAVAACVLVNVYTTYPCLLLVVQDMVWSVLSDCLVSLPGAGMRSPLAATAAAFRFAIFLANCVIGLLVQPLPAAYIHSLQIFVARLPAYNILGNVLSLVGGVCSMCCSLLLPSSFFLLLCWRSIGPAMRMAVCGLMVGGVALMLLITADNVIAIKHQSLHPSSSRLGSGILQLPGLTEALQSLMV